MNMRKRVVFGTNILVSALVFPGGQGEAALQRIIDQTDQLLLSRPLLTNCSMYSHASLRAMQRKSGIDTLRSINSVDEAVFCRDAKRPSIPTALN